MPLLYHAYVYLEFLILACTIYILAPDMPFTLEKQKFIRRSRTGRHSFLSGRRHRFCNRLAVNDKGNDRGDHFRDPKRMPDADGAEKPAEPKRSR